MLKTEVRQDAMYRDLATREDLRATKDDLKAAVEETKTNLFAAVKEMKADQAHTQDRLRPYVSGVVLALVVIAFNAWAAAHGAPHAQQVGGGP